MTFTKLVGFWYKPHRGSLSDSVHEAQYFATFEQLCDYLEKEWNVGGVQHYTKENIFICAAYAVDERIGAKLHYVGCTSSNESGVPQCFGHVFQEVDMDVWNAYRDSAIKNGLNKES